MTENDKPNEETNVGAAAQEPESSATPSQSAELEEQKKKYLYLRADFDNFRRQVFKEREENYKFGGEQTLKLLLPIFDDLERAAEAEVSADNFESYKNGVQLIITQLKKAFERAGLEEINCQGQAFDPTVHEALTSESKPDLAPNTVTQVFRKGYRLHGKLIRPAQVVVNTGEPKGD